MIRKAGFAAVLLAALPSAALAAGFASGSLFLSDPSPMEGDTVMIHAVVANDASGKFAGTLLFSDDGKAIGSVPVSLNANESSVYSISWKPTVGSHPVSATLKDSSGTAVQSQQQTFSVAAKPVPVQDQPAAAVESSSGIQQSIGSVSPTAEKYAAPVFSTLDSARSAAADTLDSQLNSTKARLAPSSPGQVLGAEAVKNASKNPMGSVMYLLNTLYFYLLTLLRFIVGSAAVFYPVFALAFLYILWRGFRLVRRPSY